MKKRFLAGFVALTLALTGATFAEGNVTVAKAAVDSMSASLTDPNGYRELSVGDQVYVSGCLLDENGNAMEESAWEFFTQEEVEAEAEARGTYPLFYSDDNGENLTAEGCTPFEGVIPEAAFGKYVYRRTGGYDISDGDNIFVTVRSDYRVTAWAGKDVPCTVSSNGDGKTVSVFSIWKTSSLSIPSTVTVNGKKYKVTAVGSYALEQPGKEALKSLTIPSGMKEIGEEAFKDASKLKTITIKGNLTKVGKNAFAGINKKAVFKIKASKTNYSKIVKRIKNSGVPKTVTFKRI